MSWDEHHSRSERFAIEAERAARSADRVRVEDLYRQAAIEELAALEHLPPEKQRTRGITAVSAVALWYKARDYSHAEKLAHQQLASGLLPLFAQSQLRELLHIIWSAQSAEAAGIHFVPGDVLVSIKGGRVLHGGAPLDLIVRKVEGIQSVLFRTVEMLLNRPFRRHGGPTADVQSMFQPWLFQAPAGSYQFAVRVQEPEQKELWEPERPKVERVTATFFQVLGASATDPENELPRLVPDQQYREAFLSLSRNLAPTGKSFERLEIRDIGASEPLATFASETRQRLNVALRKAKPPKGLIATDEEVILNGVLRAVHLDQDWLEVVTLETLPSNKRIGDAGDALDDVVGPMVNRRVTVHAIRRGDRYLYRDIELDE